MSSGSVKLAHLGEDENRPEGLWKGGYTEDTSLNKLSPSNSSAVGLEFRKKKKNTKSKVLLKMLHFSKKCS